MSDPEQEAIPELAAIEVQARAVGLDRAWADFREDVIAAAREAAQRPALDALPPADEPWPPMRVERAR